MEEKNKILLSTLQKLGPHIPNDIKTALGEFPWEERLSKIVFDKDKLRIHFFSDMLNLSHKTYIENIIRENLSAEATEITVYFEKKEKSQAQQSSNDQAPNESKPKTNTPPPSSKRAIEGVKKIIAVASGKGGVGKSTVAVNLASALHNQGYKVGILDADIYGPSVPTMLNIHQDPQINDKNKIIPPEGHGLKVMSFGFFAPEETPVIWRGPMIMKALQQFFWDVEWGELDFLIVDLPPGTGDAQLTLVQSIPITGAVIVTTPQNVALLDAVKGIAMFRKTEVPIIGVVENMSTYHCATCGTESHIFGRGGAQRISEKFEVQILGEVPLIPEIRAAGDLGEPLTTKLNNPVRVRFSEIAEKVVSIIAKGL